MPREKRSRRSTHRSPTGKNQKGDWGHYGVGKLEGISSGDKYFRALAFLCVELDP